MFFYHYVAILFYTKMSAKLRAILLNKTCKTLEFLCRSINSAHDDQFCAELSPCRITKFWHSLPIYDHIPRKYRRKQKWALLNKTLCKLQHVLEDAHSDVAKWRGWTTQQVIDAIEN